MKENIVEEIGRQKMKSSIQNRVGRVANGKRGGIGDKRLGGKRRKAAWESKQTKFVKSILC